MQTYKHKSNARRAAREAGLDPDLAVKAIGSAFFLEHANGDDGLDMPEHLMREPQTEEQRAAILESTKRTNGPTREITMPKTKAAKKPAKSKGKDKTAEVIRLMSRTGGASVDELTKATDWLPHTLRARISRLAKSKKDGGEGFKIERTRIDKTTTYRIAN